MIAAIPKWRVNPGIFLRLGLLSGFMLAAEAAQALPHAERVRFDSLDRVDGRVVTIEALLFRPQRPLARAEAPAVIALHGCGGLYRAARNSDPSNERKLTERHAAHAEALLAAGYVVLFPDSLGSRGLREICTIPSGERTVTPQRRRLDALAAFRWLARQPGVDAERIALLGWSHGGSTALATIDAGHREVAAFRGEGAASPFFRGAVAFYPGCSAASRNPQWRTDIPTRILIGADDDWTPAGSCEVLRSKSSGQRWPLEVTVYPGAHHGFDAPRGKVVHRPDVPNGVSPGRGVHVGPDPAAREDANRKLTAFLREILVR